MILRFKRFREIVKDRANINGLTLAQVAGRAGITPRTFSRRMNCPREMTLTEFHRIDNVLHFTPEEKEALLDKATW